MNFDLQLQDFSINITVETFLFTKGKQMLIHSDNKCEIMNYVLVLIRMHNKDTHANISKVIYSTICSCPAEIK